MLAVVLSTALSAAPMLALARRVRETVGPSSPSSPSSPPADALAGARSEVDKARAAASAGDLPLAITHFEAALALHPVPQLHYNIAVCHHRIATEASAGSPTYDKARADAVAAYNRYLAAAPDAADRADVEATVQALGGQTGTNTASAWKPALVHPDDVPDPPAFTDPLTVLEEPDPAADPTVPLQIDPPAPEPPAQHPPGGDAPAVGPMPRPATPTPPPHKNQYRVSLGTFVPLMIGSPAEVAASDELSGAPMIGLGLRAGGFLGAHGRIHLGGELSAVGQPLASTTRHILTAGWLGLTLRYEHPVAERFRIGAGGLVAGAGQTLRYTGDDPLRCGVRRSGAISQRTGILLGARTLFAALLGRQRRHAIGVTLTPAIGLHGRSTASEDEGDAAMNITPCRDEPTPFEGLGLRRGASFVLTADVGYAVRL